MVLPCSRDRDYDLVAPVPGGAIIAGAHHHLVVLTLLQVGDRIGCVSGEGVARRVSPGQELCAHLCPGQAVVDGRLAGGIPNDPDGSSGRAAQGKPGYFPEGKRRASLLGRVGTRTRLVGGQDSYCVRYTVGQSGDCVGCRGGSLFRDVCRYVPAAAGLLPLYHVSGQGKAAVGGRCLPGNGQDAAAAPRDGKVARRSRGL